MVFFFAPGCSWFLGIRSAKVDDAQDGSWRHCFVAWLYLTAKPFHMGVDVDRLACPLHHPTTCSHQTRGQDLLLGAALSHCYSGWWRLSRDVKPHMLGYLVDS
jgi:hypothetical protein